MHHEPCRLLADGTGRVNLTNSPTLTDIFFDWSPDGSKVTFTSQSQEFGDLGIYVMNADGTGKTALNNRFPVSNGSPPRWSPDGRRIAFASGIGSGGASLINADGTGEVNFGTFLFAWPSWSPDGSQLVFEGGENELWIANADGTGERRLTTQAGGRPAWSPDGRKIAFECSFLNPDESFDVEICVVNTDGSGLVRLTTDKALDTAPAWSPSGKKVAFTSRAGGTGQSPADIYVINVDGSGRVNVTNGAAQGNDASEPDFAPW